MQPIATVGEWDLHAESRGPNQSDILMKAPTAATASRAKGSLWKTFQTIMPGSLLLAAVVACAAPLSAQIVVDSTADNNDGNLGAGQYTLREAVANVANGGTITFDPMVFGTPQTINLTLGSIQLTGPRVITVIGPGRNLLTVRNNTMPKERILELQSATQTTTFTLSDMTLADGSTTDAFGGGAILSRRPLTLRRVAFTNNAATTNGGAVAIIGEGVLGETYPFVIDRCEFDNNDAAFGGGVHFSSIAFAGDSTLTMRDSLFVGNTGSSNAGALALYPVSGTGVQTTTIANCTFSGNGAGPGGGGALDVFPTTLSATAVVRLNNSTVTNNSVGVAAGGGILAQAPAGTDIRLRNTIVAGNTAASGPDINSAIAGSVRFEGGNLVGNNADINAPVVSGTNVIGTPGTPVNPQLAALANNGGLTRTHALLATSPARDLGSPAFLVADVFDLDGDANVAESIPYDQRGGDGAGPATDYPRVLGAAPDAGAFELVDLASLVVDQVLDENDGILTPGDVSLREAVAFVANGGTINFDPAVFGTPQTINLTLGNINPGVKSFTLTGPGRDLLTVRTDPGSPDAVIFFLGSYVGVPTVITDMTLADSGGPGINAGGAIRSGNDVRIRRVRFENNEAQFGGAVSFVNSFQPSMSWVVEQCEFNGNTAQFGGALLSQGQSGTANSTFVRDSLFAGNQATASGGAISILPINVGAGNNMTLTVSNSTLSGNQAAGVQAGGAIHANGIANSTVGISLVNCTVTNNTATAGTGNGGGIVLQYLGASLSLVNSIVAGNIAANGPDISSAFVNSVSIAGGNVIGNNSDINGPVIGGTNQIGTPGTPVNPQLAALANNGGMSRTHALLPGSPALNFANPATLPQDTNDLDGDAIVIEAIPYDQRGGDGAGPAVEFPRVIGSAPDAGAFESVDLASLVVDLVVDENDGILTPGDVSLREAVAFVANGGTITFDPAVFGTPQTINLTLGEMVVNNRGFSIVGPGIDLLTVRNPTARVLNMNTIGDCPLTISELTIADSTPPASPGAAIRTRSSLTVRRVRFRDNQGTAGGAVSLSRASATPVAWTFDQCEFVGNQAGQGGAIDAQSALAQTTPLTIRDCLFAGNSVTNSGGALLLFLNAAGAGNNINATISNTTFSGNQSSISGGAIIIIVGAAGAQASATLVNCTVTDNASAAQGGGVWLIGNGSLLTLRNTIVAGNTAPAGPNIDSAIAGAVTIGGGNVIGNNAGINAPVPAGTNVIGTPGTPVNALLAALANNGGLFRTHALLAGSPARNLGDNALLPADVNDLDGDANVAEPIPYDQRGGDGAGPAVDYPRVFFTNVDAGAFESSLFASLVVDLVLDENDGNLTPGDVSLREAVAFVANGGTITFDPAVFGVPQTINLTLGEMVVNNRGFSIVGPGIDLLTVRTAMGSPDARILLMNTSLDTPLTMSDITFANAGGVGIQGGAFFSRSDVTMRRVRFRDNTASVGPMVLLNQSASPLTWTFDQCEFTGNQATSSGGAIFAQSQTAHASTLIVRDSLFEGNQAANGGAVVVFPTAAGAGNSMQAAFSNSTFSGNIATNAAAAVLVDSGFGGATSTATLVNCTVTGNTATTSSGGLFVSNDGDSFLTLRNTIVAGNSSPASPDVRSDLAGVLTIGGGNVIGNNGGITAPTISGTNVIGTPGTPVNPQLAALANNGGLLRTHALRWDSPAINLGDVALLPADVNDLDGDLNVAEAIPYDQRGGNGAAVGIDFLRNVYGAPDAGAFELPTYIVNVVTDAPDANPGDGFAETATPGETSLRAAIQESNASPGPELVAFDIPGAGPHAIAPTSPLPPIGEAVTIDGTTEPDYATNPADQVAGFADVPIVELRGDSNPTPNTNGLQVSADDVTIRGLAINRFSRNGIGIGSGAIGTAIISNYIGTTRDGVAAAANTLHGIEVGGGATQTIIGSPATKDGNVISGNANNGILLLGADQTVAMNNRIGTDKTGTIDVGNISAGIELRNDADTNIIGTNGDGINDATEGNVISGNNAFGIRIRNNPPGGAANDNNVIAGNVIGLSAAGNASLGNAIGIQLEADAAGTIIGGALVAQRNVVSGNTSTGMTLTTAPNTRVIGNYVGSDITGTIDLGNTLSGVVVQTATTGIEIGGPVAGEGNLIVGNNSVGLFMSNSSSVVVAGNRIGLSADGTSDLGNTLAGILLQNADNVTIGGATDAHRNIISGNNNTGISAGSDSTGLVIQRNWIGLDAVGAGAVRNTGSAITLVDADGAIVGGATFNDRNVIVAETIGIQIDAATTGAQILRNRIGASADGTTPYNCNFDAVAVVGPNASVIGNHLARATGGLVNLFNTSGAIVQGNLIGTDAAGNVAAGFGSVNHGVISVGSTNSLVGGTAVGEGNIIAGNGADGVTITGASNNVAVRGNVIFSNGGLGIDLVNDGVTPNDVGDGDAGPNALQNYPTITGYTVGGTDVAGSLNSLPSTTYDIDLYLNNAADPSGFGEGEIYLGSTTVMTDLAGNGTFNVAILPANIPGGAFTTTSVITATATHPTNGTSEFSATFVESDPSANPITSIDVIDGGFTARCPVRLDITFSEAVTGFDASDVETSINSAVFAVTQNTPSNYTVEVRPLATTPLPALVSCRINGSVLDLGNNPAAVVTAFFNFTQNAPPTNFTIAAGDVYGPNGLVVAMDAANCSNDPNTITLAYRSAYLPNVVDNTLGGIPAYGDNALPLVETPITIEADGSTLSSSAAATRLFAVVPSGSLTLNRATLPNNGPANQGAAILNRGRLEVVETYFFANAATEFGGAIASPQAASVTRVIRCTFGNNTASMGGGALYIAGNVGGADTNLLENVTLVGNVGAPRGGGVYIAGSTDIRSSTITNNTGGGAGFGGGVYVANSVVPVTVTMANTIVAQNTANFGPDVFVDLDPNVTTTSLGYNLVGDNTFGFAAGVGDLLGTAGTPINPQLAGFSTTGWVPTRTPLAISPARDAANPSLAALPETDARRVPRGLGLLNDRADIGAVELNDFPTAIIENIHPAIGQQKEFWLIAALADANAINNGMAEPDTINLTTVDGPYSFDGRPQIFVNSGANYLPSLSTSVTISGNDATIERSATPAANGRFLVLDAASNVRINRTTMRNGLAAGTNPERIGGALFVRGRLETVESSFLDNRALQGGAMFLSATGGTPLVIRRTTLANNTADQTGGALHVQFVSPSLLIENSTISNNDALGGQGGGVLVRRNTTFSNSTIVQNFSGVGGGGVAVELAGSIARFRNTLVALNTAAAGPDIRLTAPATIVDERYNLLGNNSGAGGVLVNNVNGNIVGTAATPVNPQIGPLANNGGPTLTHELLANSPAVDRIPFGAGAPNTDLVIDQRNSPRPRRFGYDIGAYERFAYFVPCNDIVALRDAINDANALPNFDEIFFDNNPCPTGYVINTVDNVTDGPNGLPLVTSPITFFGLGNTVLRSTAMGTPDLRLFYVGPGGDVTFNALSMAEGRLLAPGTGSAQSGGALLNRGITRFVGTAALYNNQASFGGAIQNEFNGNLTIQVGTTIRDNDASAGGAIGNWLGGTVSLRGATIRDNTALFFGGGYAASLQSNTSITLSSIINNRSFGYGGGVYVADENTNMTIENATIGANVADLEGGGIYLGARLAGDFRMTFATVSENTSPRGGGMRYLSPARVGSSIIARNTASIQGPDFNGTQAINSLGYNVVGITTGSAGFTATGDQVGSAATPLNPRLALLANYGGFSSTYLPLPGSPALDAGDPVTFPTIDQRTSPRAVSWTGIMPPRPDAGSVEQQGDADQDGIPDVLETDVLATLRVNFTTTNRFIPDSDGDGLLDGEERYLYLTNPRAVSTDADTMWDGVEVRLREENPALAAFCDPLVNNTGQFTDVDGDRLPEALNGFAVVADPGPGQDVDADGFTDRYEYAVRTNNNDPASVPRLGDVDGTLGISTNDALTIGNFAVGNNPVPFNYANADPNADAIPDAADVTLINLWLFGEVPIVR